MSGYRGPRFTAGSVTGGATQPNRARDVEWYVHDHGWCCEVVKTFPAAGTDPEKAARAYAAKLNKLCDERKGIV